MHFQKLQVYVEGALGIKNPNMSPGAASSISLSRFVSFIHSFFLSSFLSVTSISSAVFFYVYQNRMQCKYSFQNKLSARKKKLIVPHTPPPPAVKGF